MTDQQETSSKQQEKCPTPTFADDVSPDSLMSDFRGRPIVSIVVFTLIVHVVVVGVFSVGYLKDQIMGVDNSKLSEKERLDNAVREGTIALREIAERHDVTLQNLSSRFANGSTKRAATPIAGGDTPEKTDPTKTPDTPKQPVSDIEKKLNEKKAGPAVPDLSPDKEDDLFK